MGSHAGSRPNIVLINADDLGYGDLGCYGSAVNATPRLDRMAAEGVRFTDFSMASPVCSPSRGAMLTGCYPPRIGFGSFDGLPVLFPGQGVGLDPAEATMGSVLSDAGYRTLMVGKWHCGDQRGFLPTEHGFDRYLGIPYSNDMGRQAGTPTDDRGDQRGYPPLPLLDGDQVIEQQPDQTTLTRRYVDEVLAFVREPDDRPFFVYLAHLYVHLPIYVEDRFAAASDNGRYGAAVAAIDDAAGAILDALAELGLDDDTLVVFTSDNGALERDGGGSNLPLRGSKGTTWEGGMRVPCIARWPRRIDPGTTSDQLATSLDLLPTFAALAGAAEAEKGEARTGDRPIDGHDLSALLVDTGRTTDDAASPRETFAAYFMDDLHAVRDSRWKLHVARDGKAVTELYDLDADVGETTDVADRHPDVVARLSAVADRYRADLGDARLGIVGARVRPVGRVADPVPLTTYDPDHPYVVAEYDLPDRG